MKHFVRLLLILSMILLLTACGSSSQSVPTQASTQPTAAAVTEAPTTEPVPVERISVAFVQSGIQSDWYAANTANYQEVFSPENGYSLLYADCGEDAAAQTEAVREFIRQGADYLVISPLEAEGWKDVLQEAKDAGIPVIIADRDINVKASMYDAYVGTDPEVEGKLAGSWLAEHLGEGKAQILMLEGEENDYTAKWRSRGFESVAAENSQWKILGRQFGEDTRESGRAAMEELLKKHKKFNVVLCHSDAQTLGAMEALEEAGISYGTEGDVILISFDASREGLELTLDGTIHCNVERNPLQAGYIHQLIQKMEAGEDFPSYTLVEDCAFVAPGMENAYSQTITREILDSRVY